MVRPGSLRWPARAGAEPGPFVTRVSKMTAKNKNELNWYLKFGAGDMAERAQDCPSWLNLEALPVFQQIGSATESSPYYQKFRAHCTTCESFPVEAVSKGRNGWVNGAGLCPEFYDPLQYPVLRAAKTHGKDEGLGHFTKKTFVSSANSSNAGHGSNAGHVAASLALHDSLRANAAAQQMAAGDQSPPQEVRADQPAGDTPASENDAGGDNVVHADQHESPGGTSRVLTDEEKRQLGAVMKAAMLIGKLGLPKLHMADVCDFARETRSMDMPPNNGVTYTNKIGCESMMEFVSTKTDSKRREEMLKSEFVSFTADGNTDKTIKHNLIIYCFYLFEGQLCSCYIKLVKCSGDAESITTAVIAALGPELAAKLVGGSVDGAAVMIGKNGNGANNVRALLQARFPHMVVVHCSAHRSALAAKAAAEASEFAVALCDAVQDLYNVFSHSYVDRGAFELVCEEIDENAVTHKRICVTRWLSRGNCFLSLTKTLNSNLITIDRLAAKEGGAQADKDTSATAVRAKICTTQFVLGVPIFAAMLHEQNEFNLIFQSGSVRATQIKTSRDSFLSKLEHDFLRHESASTDAEIMAAVRQFPIMIKDHGVGKKQKLIPGQVSSIIDKFSFTGRACKYASPVGPITLDVTHNAANGQAQLNRTLKELHAGCIHYAKSLKSSMFDYFPDDTLNLLAAFEAIDVWTVRAVDSVPRLAEFQLLLDQYAGQREIQKLIGIDPIEKDDLLEVHRIATDGWGTLKTWDATVLDASPVGHPPGSITVQFVYSAAAGNFNDVATFVPNKKDVDGSRVVRFLPDPAAPKTRPALVDSASAIYQWPKFCSMVESMRNLAKNAGIDTRSKFLKYCLRVHTTGDRNELRHACPDILTMVEITEVIPSNATVNETGFSAGSHLKGDRQARMSPEELDVKLRLYFAFRKYGHTDKLLTDLSFVDEGALVQQWFDTQPESSKSLPGRKRSFERRFSASDRQPHMKRQKFASVDSGTI